jgi:precorrin-6B C5,15-methyltransferase / cobalt-precorrin-6B C5,C15-methyltransferase
MNTLCHIIGVLDNGTASLNSQTISLLHSAKHVIAGTRVLELFANEMPNAKTYDLTSNLKNVPLWISNALNADESVVVLASGDPLCHGIGSFLAGKIEPEKLQILPNLSTIQLAFSELKLAWQNAKIVSIHNKDAGEVATRRNVRTWFV